MCSIEGLSHVKITDKEAAFPTMNLSLYFLSIALICRSQLTIFLENVYQKLLCSLRVPFDSSDFERVLQRSHGTE